MIFGADVAGLRELAGRLTTAGERLATLRSEIDGAVAGVPWHGPAGTAFRQQWAVRLGPALASAGDLLVETADKANRNAADQERTSADDGARLSGGDRGGHILLSSRGGGESVRAQASVGLPELRPVEPRIHLFPDEVLDKNWVPQGCTYDEGNDWLLVSYYDSKEELPSRIAVYDRSTGELVKWVSLDTVDVKVGGHVGGLAIGHGNLYIASSDEGKNLTIVSLDELEATESGSTLPDSESFDLKAASYVAVHNDRLYVGHFDEDSSDVDKMYEYRLDDNGRPVGAYNKEYDTPNNAQGLAVNDREFVFSVSCGRDNPSEIVTRDRDTLVESSITTHNMSEGIVFVPPANDQGEEELFVVFESGSNKYWTPHASPTNEVWSLSNSARIGHHLGAQLDHAANEALEAGQVAGSVAGTSTGRSR